MISHRVHKSVVGNERAHQLDEKKVEDHLNGVVQKHLGGEKKRNKTMKNFEENKLYFIKEKMNDKKEAAKAGLDEVYSKKMEKLEKIKERRDKKEKLKKMMLTQKDKGNSLLKEIHDVRKENVLMNQEKN